MKKLMFALLLTLGFAGLNVTNASVSPSFSHDSLLQDTTAKKDTTKAPKPAPADTSKTEKSKQ